MAAVTLLILPIRPGADHGDGQQEHAVVVAPLLGADLDHALGLLGDLAELLPLVDRQGQRLLAVDVLARLHGVDADLGVPVVGRADDHGVDVLAVEELAVVLVDVGLALADALVVLGLLGVALVDVADGQEVAVVRRARGRRPSPGRRRRSGRAAAGRSWPGSRRPSSGPTGATSGSSSGLAAETRRKSRRFCDRRTIVATPLESETPIEPILARRRRAGTRRKINARHGLHKERACDAPQPDRIVAATSEP